MALPWKPAPVTLTTAPRFSPLFGLTEMVEAAPAGPAKASVPIRPEVSSAPPASKNRFVRLVRFTLIPLGSGEVAFLRSALDASRAENVRCESGIYSDPKIRLIRRPAPETSSRGR